MKDLWAQVLCLAALVMLNVHLKVRHSTTLPRYDPADDTGYFKVESALQYRYAAMLAYDVPVPAVDRGAQYPEGLRPYRDLPMLMEQATGLTWKLWPFKRTSDFRLFVILWVAAVSSLSIVALYLAALRLTRDAPLAMTAAWAYGLSWAAVANMIGSYTFECLALPLMFSSFACFCVSLGPEEGRGRAWAAASGLFMALGLGTWHVTRFYLAAFYLAVAWLGLRWRLESGGPAGFGLRARLQRASLLESVGFLNASCVLAGVVFPVLRESRFLLSPTMVLGYALLAALARGPAAAGVALAAGGAAAFAFGQVPVESSAFGHTYWLFIDKLRFLLAKPADPAALSQEARYLWAGPFNSPDPAFLVFTFLPLGLLVLPRLASAFQGRGARPGVQSPAPPHPAWTLVDVMAALSALGTAMVARLVPFLAFFLCLGSAKLRLEAGSWRRSVVLVAMLLLAGVEGLKTRAPYSRLNVFMMLSAPLAREDNKAGVSVHNERLVLKWLKAWGGGRPVLAHIGISGPILAYSGVPVVLNPKGELALNRRKTQEFLSTLYSSEESFLRFCEKNGAGFFLYNTGYLLDESPDGTRYASGSMGLKADQAVVKFHFHPGALTGFRLAYQNPEFRVFTVGPADAGGKKKPSPKEGEGLPKEPVYDIDLFSPRQAPDGTLSLDVAGVLARMRTHRRELFRARFFARLGQREAALDAYNQALAAWPASGGLAEEIERLRGGAIPVERRDR
ncbi:MAG: hypothetical protein HY927_04970 [Elusimicrobia bacterium]|nr:hypothetical protein [Elusimicrobiota bacterium]